MQFKIITVFFVLAAIVFACGNDTPRSSSSGKALSATSPGAKIYRKYCVTCHGIDGTMQLNGAKDFTLSTLSLEERIQVITNGRRLMTPFKGILSEKKIREVAEHTMTFKKDK